MSRTRPNLEMETGKAVGVRLPLQQSEISSKRFVPFLLMLAYDRHGRPHKFPEMIAEELKEVALCQPCQFVGYLDRVPLYTPMMFDYLIDSDAIWKLWGRTPLHISAMPSRKATITWIGIEHWFRSGDRRRLYDCLANHIAWSVRVPLPKLALQAAIALERDNLPDINWTSAILEAERKP